MPAISLETAVLYVAAAYIVFMVLLLVYVGIIGRKMGRLEQELGDLEKLSRTPSGDLER